MGEVVIQKEVMVACSLVDLPGGYHVVQNCRIGRDAPVLVWFSIPDEKLVGWMRSARDPIDVATDETVWNRGS